MRFEHIHDKKCAHISGYYDDADGVVYLSDGLGTYECEAVYYHERQHRICHQTGCKCWGKKSSFLSEYHAYRAEARDVFAKRNRKLARAFLYKLKEDVKKYNRRSTIWRDNKLAMEYMMRTNLFHEFLRWYKIGGNKR